jgi:hypothetical protein
MDLSELLNMGSSEHGHMGDKSLKTLAETVIVETFRRCMHCQEVQIYHKIKLLSFGPCIQ